ncbi:MAG: helix-turn-helix transcriptional regulator [Betaproteobacteria bacterium]|nr:helix-turn-helix transcriptional regulator [Betaproteobacteria bacterium]
MTRPASAPLVTPTITYSAVAGKVIERLRDARGLTQEQLGGALGIGQSAYSRLEQGQTSMSLAQLHVIAEQLNTTPGSLLHEADTLTRRLLAQGVQVKNEKEIPTAAILVGLGILAALLAAGK